LKIVFNLQSVGLGNNGGSRTLIKSAETLKELGHEAFIWTSANNYSWHKIKVPVVSQEPKADVIIATGYRSVKSTLASKTNKKYYYIRGFELWQANKKDLLKSYRSLNCIVNSIWLKEFLNKEGIDCGLAYPGLDFDDFYIDPFIVRQPIIGGLFSKKHETKRHVDIIEIGKRLDCKVLLLNRDVINPSRKQLNDFYNSIQVWVAPTELEGLHNCPMEASLCGCAVVANDHPENGMKDYCNSKTSLVYNHRDIREATSMTNQLLQDYMMCSKLNRNMVDLLYMKIGDRKFNMQKLVEVF